MQDPSEDDRRKPGGGEKQNRGHDVAGRPKTHRQPGTTPVDERPGGERADDLYHGGQPDQDADLPQ